MGVRVYASTSYFIFARIYKQWWFVRAAREGSRSSADYISADERKRVYGIELVCRSLKSCSISHTYDFGIADTPVRVSACAWRMGGNICRDNGSYEITVATATSNTAGGIGNTRV